MSYNEIVQVYQLVPKVVVFHKFKWSITFQLQFEVSPSKWSANLLIVYQLVPWLNADGFCIQSIPKWTDAAWSIFAKWSNLFSLPLPILTENTVLVLKYIFMYLQLLNYVFFKYQMAQPFEVKKNIRIKDPYKLAVYLSVFCYCLYFGIAGKM